MKFRLLEGCHAQGGILHTKGDVIESTSDLESAFPGRFQRIGKEGKVDVSLPIDNPEKVEDQVEILSKKELVDKDFDYSPEETGFHVYKEGNLHFVYDIDDMERPLNKKGLTKTKVLPFIKKQYEE